MGVLFGKGLRCATEVVHGIDRVLHGAVLDAVEVDHDGGNEDRGRVISISAMMADAVRGVNRSLFLALVCTLSASSPSTWFGAGTGE